jgi:hypothetical protein
MHTQVTTPTSGTSAAKTVAALAASVLALLLVDQATRGPFSAHDGAVVAWFASHRSGTLDGPLRAASLLGGPSATSVYAAIAVAWYLVSRRIGAATAIGILIYGGALLNALIKETVHADGRWQRNSSPCGHSFRAVTRLRRRCSPDCYGGSRGP